jgi:hypothetical protein
VIHGYGNEKAVLGGTDRFTLVGQQLAAVSRDPFNNASND